MDRNSAATWAMQQVDCTQRYKHRAFNMATKKVGRAQGLTCALRRLRSEVA